MQKHIDRLRIVSMAAMIIGIIYFYLNLFFPSSIPGLLKPAIIERPINILVLGTDKTFDVEHGKQTSEIGRSDTIMLVHYEPLKKRIFVLSIPRDCYVPIPGHYSSKINATYVLGGAELTVQTIKDMTGVNIDKYLIVNTQGIKKLVDLLGGITIDVEKDMYYTDRAQDLYINLKHGKQKLSGKEAEGYIRFRHDAMGDIGRISRQQNFLKALASALATPNTLLKSPFIIGLIRNNIKTNLSLKQFIVLANTMRQYNPKEITTVSLPGIPANNEAGSVWLINYNELKNILNQNF